MDVCFGYVSSSLKSSYSSGIISITYRVIWKDLSQDGLIMQSSTELTDRVTYEMWDANGNLQSQKVGCAPAEAFGNSGTVVILPYEGEPGIMVVEGLEKVISDGK